MNQTFPIRDWAGALVQCLCSSGHGFESHRRILDGHFYTFIFCKNSIACSEKTKEVTENGQIKKGTIKHKTSPDSFEPALSGWHLMTLPLKSNDYLTKGRPKLKKSVCFYQPPYQEQNPENSICSFSRQKRQKYLEND